MNFLKYLLKGQSRVTTIQPLHNVSLVYCIPGLSQAYVKFGDIFDLHVNVYMVTVTSYLIEKPWNVTFAHVWYTLDVCF